MRKIVTCFLTALTFTVFSGAAHASLVFSFSFENALNDGGTVTGLIRGLEEGTGPATSVEVLSNAAGFGIGEYVGNPPVNTWTVTGGVLTAFDFVSFGVSNTAPAVTDSTLLFESDEVFGATFRAGLNDEPDSVTSGDADVSTEDIGLTFTRVGVPEPTTLALVGLGLLGAGRARRKKSAA